MAEVGAYQWAVLAAAFTTHALLGIVLDSTGTLHVIFLRALHGGSGDTALATSLICCTFYAFAPVTGVLVVNCPCWQVALVGGLLGGLGLVLSAFVYSLPMLYLTFGILAGTGMGLAYIPTISCTGQVFTKYRAIAFGIASSGVGVGKFLGPFIISRMDDEFGWRGTLLLLGGITFNLCVCALIYLRPSVQMFKNQNQCASTNDKDDSPRDEAVAVSDEKGVGVKSFHPLNKYNGDRLAYTHSNYSLAAVSESMVINTGGIKKPPLESGCPTENCNGESKAIVNSSCPARTCLGNGNFPANENTLNGGCSQKGNDVSKTCLPTEACLDNCCPSCAPSDLMETWRRELVTEGDMSSLAAALSTSSLFLSEAVSAEQIPARLLYRCAVNGSMRFHLPPTSNLHSRHTSQLDLEKNKEIVVQDVPSAKHKHLKKRGGFKLNAFLMRDPYFLTLCINNVLYSMGYALAHVHLPAFAIDRGQTTDMGNLLVSTVGIASLVGKILLGWIAQLSWLSPMSVYTITCIMAAVATAILPAFSSFPMFLSYAIFFGFISGSFGAVLPSLVVSLTAVDLLPSAYGFLLAFEAVGFLLGPSIGGWLFDGTGVYAASFLFGGGIMFVASLIMIYPWYCMNRVTPKCQAAIPAEGEEHAE